METAKATGVSTVKIRKILITEGLWESDTSIKIGNLIKQGLTTEDIIVKHRPICIAKDGIELVDDVRA